MDNLIGNNYFILDTMRKMINIQCSVQREETNVYILLFLLEIGHVHSMLFTAGRVSHTHTQLPDINAGENMGHEKHVNGNKEFLN